MEVTSEERERANARSRRMYLTDLQSNYATVEDRGFRMGLEIGLQKSQLDSQQIQELIRRMESARRFLSQEIPFDEIVKYTGLSYEDVQSLSETTHSDEDIVFERKRHAREYKATIDIARRMLSNHRPIELIAECTGLSLADVAALRNN